MSMNSYGVMGASRVAHDDATRHAGAGQELLEQAQALVELARMLDVSALLEEPNEPERSGDELPGATGEHLTTLAFPPRAPAIVAAKAS